MTKTTLLALISISTTAIASPPSPTPAPLKKAPHITSTSNQGHTWKLWYIAKGTRSEGEHGTLTINGKPHIGKKLHESITLEGRTFIWHGPWKDRKSLWSSSGWLPKDLTHWKTTTPPKSAK